MGSPSGSRRATDVVRWHPPHAEIHAIDPSGPRPARGDQTLLPGGKPPVNRGRARIWAQRSAEPDRVGTGNDPGQPYGFGQRRNELGEPFGVPNAEVCPG